MCAWREGRASHEAGIEKEATHRSIVGWDTHPLYWLIEELQLTVSCGAVSPAVPENHATEESLVGTAISYTLWHRASTLLLMPRPRFVLIQSSSLN